MAYEIIYKKRFVNKLLKLLDYLKADWSIEVADKFIERLKIRVSTISHQPFIGMPSNTIKDVRSILITRHNRIYYRIKGDKIEVINLYDTRIDPKRNRYK